jgi:hypothetical protein
MLARWRRFRGNLARSFLRRKVAKLGAARSDQTQGMRTCCETSAQTSDTNYGWKFFDSIVSLSGKRSCRWQWPPTKRKAISSFSILNRMLLSGKTFMVSRLSLYPRGGELIASEEAGFAGVHTIVVFQGITPLPVLDAYRRIDCVERFSSTKK